MTRNCLALIFACASLPALSQSPITNIDNTTMTPTPGAGHDYIQSLSETVNPANGSVSIRIAAPAPTERGMNMSTDAYVYDSTGKYMWTPEFLPASPNSGYVYTLWQVNPINNIQPSTGGNTLTGQPNVLNGNGAPGTLSYDVISLNASVSINCVYYTNYIYFDSAGGPHALNMLYIPPAYHSSNGCGYFNINYSILTGGDEQITASIDSSSNPPVPGDAYVYDLHGNQLNPDYKVEDTNGNYLNGTGRTYAGVYKGPDGAPTSLTIPGLSAPYTYSYTTQSIPGGAISYAPFNPNATLLSATSGAYCPNAFLTLNTAGSPATVSTQNLTIVNLPDGLAYKILFDPNYNLVSKITYPTGATAAYTWANNHQSDGVTYTGPQTNTGDSESCSFRYDMPAIQSRIVSFNGTTPALEQTFSYSTTWSSTGYGSAWTTKTTAVTTTDLLRTGTPSFKTVYTYLPVAAPVPPESNIGSSSAFPVENTITYYDFSGALLKTTTKAWVGAGNNLLGAECTTLPNGQTSGIFYQYQNEVGTGQNQGLPDLVTDKAEYDYGLVTTPCVRPSTTPTRETITAYQTFGITPLHTYIQDRPSSVTVKGNGTTLSQTTYTYDQYGVAGVTSAINHDETNYGPGVSTLRGNLTNVTQSCLQSCTSPVTKYSYDETGQVMSSTDPNSNTTTYSYGDAYSSGYGSPSGNTNTYVKTITPPAVNGVSHAQSYTYGFNNGKVTSHTDENLNTTFFCYFTGGCGGTALDPWARVTESTSPDGGYTIASYVDAGPQPYTTTSTEVSSGVPSTSETIYDAYGHTIESESASDPYNADIIATTYDGLGNVYTASNPYRAGDPVNLTTYTYDALGRTTKVQHPVADGTSATSTYSSNVATYTDEVGNTWQRTSDALGRLTQVLEPNGSSPSATMATNYTYNALNDLNQVTQYGGPAGTSAGVTRLFGYDSLGRLLQSQNPESGTIQYNYDPNGNLTSKVSPLVNATSGTQTQTIGYCYDALNRMTYKFYGSPSCTSPSNPAASYGYDVSSITGAANDIGRLTDEKAYIAGTLVAENSPYEYDTVGGLQGENEDPFAPLSASYGFSYSYDLAGDQITGNNGMASATNAITFQSSYDAVRRLQQVIVAQPSGWSTSSYPTTLLQANAATQTFFNAPPYDAAGHLVGVQMGITTALTNGAITTQRAYDSRERVVSEVDAGYPIATAASGSTDQVSLSGLEQTSGSGSPAHATGTTTITGIEHSTLVCPTPHSPRSACSNVPDQGSVNVNVNGFVASGGYGSGSTSGTVAANLAAQLNVAGSPVTATVSGNVVTLTSVATGTAANYTFSTTTSSDFSGTDSGPTLTGGAAGLVADTGTITVVIDGISAGVNWGSTSTVANLASSLASAINTAASSVVRATPNATSVSLVSTTTGASVNYTVLASATDTNSGGGFSPSFTVQASNMNGGANQATSYQQIYAYTVPTGGYGGNNNLLSVTDSITGQWTYGYDTLNRLLSSTTTGGHYGGEHGCWIYDAFGNKQMEVFSTTSSTPCASITPSAFTNNRAPTEVYDLAGNVVLDPTIQNSYTYDPEGRVCAVGVTMGGPTSYTQYIYDAEGRRVAKGTSGSGQCSAPTSANGFTLTNQYLLGLGGEQVTELNGSGSWLHTNAWIGGKLLATYDPTRLHFALSDPLGTKRVQVQSSGTPELNCVSLPYGDDVSFSRSSNCYTPSNGNAYNDTTENHYTGKERDAESGNDYFGARYYASSMGRFSSPDSVAGDPEDPQSWNLYSYVRNKPTISTDPDGHDCIYADGNGGGYVQRGDCTNAGGKDDNGVYVDGTIDVDSFKYNASNNSSSFSFTPYDSPTGTIGTGVLQGPNLNNGFEPGSLGAAVFGAQNNATWANASNGVNTVTAGYAAVYAGAACYFACPAAAAAVGRWGLQRLAMGASSPALLNLINRLYQAQDEIPGGTAGAVRNEVSTGEFINGGHSIKAQEMITALTKLINSGELSGSDQMIAGHIISDLKSSLGK